MEPYLIHPIVVHFPIALLITATLLYVFATMKTEKASVQSAADWTFGLGLLALLLAGAAGFLAYYTVAHGGASHEAMHLHRNWAIATLVVFLILGIWRLKAATIRPLFIIGIVAASTSLAVTGFLGGHLVFHYGLGVEQLPDIEGSRNHDSHDHGMSKDMMNNGDMMRNGDMPMQGGNEMPMQNDSGANENISNSTTSDDGHDHTH